AAGDRGLRAARARAARAGASGGLRRARRTPGRSLALLHRGRRRPARPRAGPRPGALHRVASRRHPPGRLPGAHRPGVGRVAAGLVRDLVRVPDVRPSNAWRLWQRDATIYRHTYKFNILPNFFEPFLYLLAMGLGLGAYLARIKGFRYLDFIAPGLVATAAMF